MKHLTENEILNKIAYDMFKTDYKYISLDGCKVAVLEQYVKLLRDGHTDEPKRAQESKGQQGIVDAIIQAQIGTPEQHDAIQAHIDEYLKRWPNYRNKFTSLEWYHIFLDFSDKFFMNKDT